MHSNVTYRCCTHPTRMMIKDSPRGLNENRAHVRNHSTADRLYDGSGEHQQCTITSAWPRRCDSTTTKQQTDEKKPCRQGVTFNLSTRTHSVPFRLFRIKQQNVRGTTEVFICTDAPNPRHQTFNTYAHITFLSLLTVRRPSDADVGTSSTSADRHPRQPVTKQNPEIIFLSILLTIVWNHRPKK